MKIEICAGNLQSALNAQSAGADRIELCSELSVGGLTPSYGSLHLAMQHLNIPVHVLIRPRSGDFTYSETEFEVVKKDILHCKNSGCAAVVSGILTDKNSIDFERTAALVKMAKPMKFIFHRAFDWVENPMESLPGLIAIGVAGVLSSGGKKNAIEGIHQLKKMLGNVDNVLEIIPGSGINSSNIGQFKAAGFDIVHSSASIVNYPKNNDSIAMNNLDLLQKNGTVQSDFKKIRDLVLAVK